MTRQPPPTWILLTFGAVLFSFAAVFVSAQFLINERPVRQEQLKSTTSVVSKRRPSMLLAELRAHARPAEPKDVPDETIEGTIVAAKDLEVREDLSGSFVACFSGYFTDDGKWIRQKRRLPVAVTEGSWKVEGLPGATSFHIEDLELDGVAAALVDSFPPYSNHAGPHRILAEVAPSVTLRVTDCRTGQDVPSFTLARAEAFHDAWSPSLETVPREMIFRWDVPSPFELRAEEASDFIWDRWEDVDYWVYSPGLSWKALRVDFSEARAVEVALAPGVELSITLDGVEVPADVLRLAEVMNERKEVEQLLKVAWRANKTDIAQQLEVRLAELEGKRQELHPRHTHARKVELQVEQLPETTSRTLRRLVLGDETFTFQGLPAARYRVRVAMEASRQQVFAEQIVDARQYGLYEIHLDVDPFPPPRELAPLSGLLYVGPDKERPSITLDIVAADSTMHYALSTLQIPSHRLSPYLERPGWWSWDAGLVLQGRYSIENWSLDCEQEFDVGPEGNSTVLVELPPDS